MAPDPIEVIVARTWVANHVPRHHVSIAAVDWICEKTLLHILQNELEEALAVGTVELDLIFFQTTEDGVFVPISKLVECPSRKSLVAVAIERGQAFAVLFGWPRI
jgi:hypothetical protein